MRTSFKTLASKKATATWRLRKSLSNNKLLWKVMPSRCSMVWKHTHWRKGFLLLVLLKVCGLLLFRKSKKTFGILWSVWVFFAFLGVKGLNKFCLWEANLLVYIDFWFDVRNCKFIVKNSIIKCWLYFRIFLWRTQK